MSLIFHKLILVKWDGSIVFAYGSGARVGQPCWSNWKVPTHFYNRHCAPLGPGVGAACLPSPQAPHLGTMGSKFFRGWTANSRTWLSYAELPPKIRWREVNRSEAVVLYPLLTQWIFDKSSIFSGISVLCHIKEMCWAHYLWGQPP